MKIAIGTDHNGVNIKKEIIKYLNNKGIETLDLSSHNAAFDDYPDYAFAVCDEVIKENADFGVLLCGTGIGMSIAANKVKGIRCAHVTSTSEAMLARQHNNANVIAMGTNSNKVNDIIKMLDLFINTNFSKEERHARRNKKILDYDMSRK